MADLLETCPAVGILAGGRSRRMGFDKAGAMLGSAPMIGHVARAAAPIAERLYVLGRSSLEEWPPELPVEFLPDATAESRGPVAGILALLKRCQSPALVLGCDIPLIRTASIRALWIWHQEARGAVATLTVLGGESGMRAEPTFAVYTPECAPLLESIAASCGSLQKLIAEPRVARFFAGTEMRDELLNVNDPAALAQAESLLAKRRF